MTEYQEPGCWLVTSEAVTSTTEAVTLTAEAQLKHDEIREKEKKIRLRAKRATYMRSSERSEPRICAERSRSDRAKRAACRASPI